MRQPLSASDASGFRKFFEQAQLHPSSSSEVEKREWLGQQGCHLRYRIEYL